MAKSSIRLRMPNEERPRQTRHKGHQEGADNGGKLAEDVKETEEFVALVRRDKLAEIGAGERLNAAPAPCRPEKPCTRTA